MTEPVAQPEAEAAPTAEEIADLRAARAERDALKAKLSDDAKAEREARKAAQAEAEKAGELAKAYESAKARLAELEGLEPLANRWREHESAEVSRLDKRAAELPEAFADLYKSASDLASKAKILAAFDSAKGPATKQTHAPVSIGAPASTPQVIDFAAAARDPKQWAEAKERDGKGAIAWIQARMRPSTGAPSTLARGPSASRA